MRIGISQPHMPHRMQIPIKIYSFFEFRCALCSVETRLEMVPEPDVSDSDKKDLIEASDADSKNEQMAKTEQTAEVPTRRHSLV